jgi:hypothetical protein
LLFVIVNLRSLFMSYEQPTLLAITLSIVLLPALFSPFSLFIL